MFDIEYPGYFEFCGSGSELNVESGFEIFTRMHL